MSHRGRGGQQGAKRQRSSAGFSGALAAGVLTLVTGCGSNVSPTAIPAIPTVTGTSLLTAAETDQIIKAAAASVNVPLTIAVSDRAGNILAIYNKAAAPTTAIANFSVVAPAQDVAAALARTAAFFSNNQAPIGSRTVRFLSGIHFPPNVLDTESAPLYGIENTNRGCGFNTTYLSVAQSLPAPTSISGAGSPRPGYFDGEEGSL